MDSLLFKLLRYFGDLRGFSVRFIVEMIFARAYVAISVNAFFLLYMIVRE